MNENENIIIIKLMGVLYETSQELCAYTDGLDVLYLVEIADFIPAPFSVIQMFFFFGGTHSLWDMCQTLGKISLCNMSVLLSISLHIPPIIHILYIRHSILPALLMYTASTYPHIHA